MAGKRVNLTTEELTALLAARLAAKGADPYLTTEELAALLRTSPANVRMMRSRGDAPESFRRGKRRLWPRESAEAWVRARTA